MRLGGGSPSWGGVGEASGSGSSDRNQSRPHPAEGTDTADATIAPAAGSAESQATATATATTTTSSNNNGNNQGSGMMAEAGHPRRRNGGGSGGPGPPQAAAPGQQQQGQGPTSLYDAMRAPGARAPDVHVIGQMPSDLGLSRKESLDPREDLWLTTFDGRYNSTLIPIIVGLHPDAKTFTVHKHILEKTDFFRKALSGHFRESETQIISLPEEDPAIFHHVVAYLYEGRYEPIKPIASELIPDPDKGKGREPADRMDSDSDSAESILSNSTARSRRRRERRRRHDDRVYESMRQKHPGVHRPNCNCPQCLILTGPPCWSCGMSRHPPPPGPPPHILRAERERERTRNRRMGNARRLAELTAMGGPMNGVPMGAAGVARPGSPPPVGGAVPLHALVDPNGGRIKGEDMRTWLLTYELNIDVYVCANKFLMDDFKRAVARVSIDMLESAGSDAAHPRVLQLCRRLYDGLGTDMDPFLRMVFARVGFLQPAFARSPAADEATAFLVANPDIVALVLRETTCRREEDLGSRGLPSMERHLPHPGAPGGPLTPGSIFDWGGPGGHQGRGPYPYNHFHVPPRPPRFP